MTEKITSEKGKRAEEVLVKKGLAPWAKVLLAASILLMVVGGALTVMGMLGGDETPPPQTSGEGSNLAMGLTGDVGEDGERAPAEAEPSALEEWSPTVFRLGFSFFVGFAVAYALRSFLKIAIIAIGVILILVFGLQYLGAFTIDWSTLERPFNATMEWLKEQTAGFKTFITGQLPSAGAAGVGLVAGFRRK